MRLISDLSSDNIKGLVWSLAIPSMLSQLVSTAPAAINVFSAMRTLSAALELTQSMASATR